MRSSGLRVLRAADFETRSPDSERVAPATTMSALVLVGVLPLFAQSFYYLNELPPPYLLSKAWPILVLPLTIYGWATLRLPAKALYGLLLAYLIGFTPLNSMLRLGNGLTDAMVTTVKVWPLTYYFALAALLAWLRPGLTSTRRVVIGLGWFTFALMVLLWVAAPSGWYTSDAMLGKLMMVDAERGYRIYMPMFFGMLLIFYLARRFFARFEWWTGLSVVIAFILLFSIYKQRASIGSAMLIVGLAGVAMAPLRLRVVALAGAGVVVAFGLLGLVALGLGDLEAVFGTSLTVRQVSLDTAIDFLGMDVGKWAFGVGATTRFGAVTLVDIFGNNMFYLADIGWIGVIFEYGIVGAVLIFLVYAVGFLVVRPKPEERGDPLRQAFGDYILYMLVASSIYSLVFTPGELATVMALAFYFRREGQTSTVASSPGAPDRPSFQLQR
jgi:hypothetical protein